MLTQNASQAARKRRGKIVTGSLLATQLTKYAHSFHLPIFFMYFSFCYFCCRLLHIDIAQGSEPGMTLPQTVARLYQIQAATAATDCIKA